VFEKRVEHLLAGGGQPERDAAAVARRRPAADEAQPIHNNPGITQVALSRAIARDKSSVTG